MSISRRGLFAVGLTAAMVSSIGVVSMINAAAGETGNHVAATSTADDPGATDLAEVPPPTSSLPWGEAPRPMKLGEMGSSSAELAASGASAAKDDRDSEPTPEFGPKGISLRGSVLLTQETNVEPPPVPPGLAAEPVPGASNVYYWYGYGKQSAVTAGAAASLTIAKPKVASGDWHSLAEIAVQSADGQQVVEVGWTVDRLVNGDNDPHLFVFNWVNGGPKCYNGCGFVPATGASIKPGDTLVSGAVKNFGIQHLDDGWWIAYDTEWIGMFPNRNWNVTFNKSGLVQFYGEVAGSNQKSSCTEMGNGAAPDTSAAARVSSVVYVDGPPVALTVSSTSDFYQAKKLTERTFRYGGPVATAGLSC